MHSYSKIACLGLAVAGVALAVPPRARGQAADQSIVDRWAAQVQPEAGKVDSRAYYKPIDTAQEQVKHGLYRKALSTLFDIKIADPKNAGPKDADPAEVALVRADALAALGDLTPARAALGGKTLTGDPRAVIRLAKIDLRQNQTAAAIDRLQTLLKQKPDSAVGHYWLGRAMEQAGKVPEAVSAYQWFVDEPQDYVNRWQQRGAEGFDNDAETLTTAGLAIDRWAQLTSSYKTLPALHDTLLDMFVKAYDVVDRSYWPAHVAAARFYIEHDNNEDAVKELLAAAAENPRDTETYKLLATVSLDGYNFAGVEKAIETIREYDPGSPVAELLDARNLLLQRRPDLAAGPIDRVLADQPDNIEALGLKAAVAALQLREADAQRLVKQVETIDPDNAAVYFELAEQLGALRQYPRAAGMYQVAIERAPWLVAARNGLGLLYTQSGDEDQARVELEAARVLDPFNLRTTNYLRLLDDMSQMARLQTPHFEVIYDAKLDPMIPIYFGPWLEHVYSTVCGTFKHEPAVKTKIEVFPTHAAFSVRTTGSPWIGTVGASTGSVIAMVTPRKGDNTLGTYNWAQVLMHEYTHTVTLSATQNRIPHWMTEGLAVVEERAPLQWVWVPLLYQAVSKNELFTMEGLTWGFVRPKRPMDRQLAYAQSAWVCEYIEETYGHAAILKMLEEFRQGRLQDQVFPDVLHTPLATFQTDFFAWCGKKVQNWGYDKETTQKYEALRGEGEKQIKAKKFPEALQTWLKIEKLRPMDPLPKQRLAGLYLTKQINKPEAAIDYLIAIDAAEIKDNRYSKRIARLCLDAGRLADAEKYATKAVFISPYDETGHELLIETLKKQGNDKAAAAEANHLAALRQWETQEQARREAAEPK